LALRNLLLALLLTLPLAGHGLAAPDAEIDSPQHKAILGDVFAISGTRTTDTTRVELKIKNTAGQFWNGNSFQNTWIRVAASLDTPTTWRYPFSAPGLNDRLVIHVYASDTTGNNTSSAGYVAVTADSQPPVAEFLSPQANTSHSGAISIELNASDNYSVSATALVIRNAVGQYWDGNNFTSDWRSVDAVKEGNRWSYRLNSDYSGKIYLRGRAFDSAGNKQTSPAYLPLNLNADTQSADTRYVHWYGSG